MVPTLAKIEWEIKPSGGLHGLPLRTAVAEVPDQYMHQVAEIAIGVDPGRNFGYTLLKSGMLVAYWGTFEKEDEQWKYVRPAYRLIQTLGPKAKFVHMAIEGPAFRKQYGQPALESARAGFALSGLHNHYNVEIVPPATARAEVLGHGFNKAGDFWPSLNLNAADSVVLALYAAGVRRGDDPPQRWPEKED